MITHVHLFNEHAYAIMQPNKHLQVVSKPRKVSYSYDDVSPVGFFGSTVIYCTKRVFHAYLCGILISVNFTHRTRHLCLVCRMQGFNISVWLRDSMATCTGNSCGFFRHFQSPHTNVRHLPSFMKAVVT